MKQRFFLAPHLIAAIIVLFFVAPVFGTWNKVLTCHPAGNPNLARTATCGFFFNEFVGFIGSSGDVGIFKTTDGGNSWIRASTPVGYIYNFTQIFMTDILNGWATIEEQPPNPMTQCLFRTVDGGMTWTAIGPKDYFSCVYQTPSALVVTGRGATVFGIVSTDNGATYQLGGLKGTNGLDFVDNLHGVATGYQNYSWQKTADGGITWNYISPAQTIETWSVYGVKGSSLFYVAGETDERFHFLGGQSSVYRSIDYGATWSLVKPLTFYTTGHIAGFGEMLYIQADTNRAFNPGISGMYRSTDRGATWQSIAGPSNTADTRFVVTGCNGGVVYAFDAVGNVWKTRDGGDGAIQEPPVTPQITGNPIIFTGPICVTSYAALEMENLYCSDDSIISAELADTASDIIRSGALSITVMPNFPLLLSQNGKDSINFTWQPFKFFHTDTTVTFGVKIKYFSKVLGRTFDTIVTISAHAVSESPLADITPLQLDAGNISYCSPFDSSFTIRNKGCDTLYITGANPTTPVLYQILDSAGNILKLPIAIAPSQRMKIIISLSLGLAGPYSSNLILTLRHQGIAKDTTVTISAIGIISPGKFVSSLSADTLFNLIMTRCDSAKLFKEVITNPGCEYIRILSASLQGNSTPDISLSIGSALPLDIGNASATNKNVSVTVTVLPKILGTYSGFLKIRYQLANSPPRDTLFAYSLTVGYGSRILTVDHDTIDLGTMKLCDSRDSAVMIKNIGCDSLDLLGIIIQGHGNFTETVPQGLSPLSANQSGRIPFHFDPTQAGDITGSMTISSRSDTLPIRIVTIIAHVIPTDTITFNLLPTRNTFHAGDTLTVDLIPQQNIHGMGLKSLAFTINYNGDLLTLLSDPSGVMVLLPNAIAPPTGSTLGTPKHTAVRISILGLPTLEMDADSPVIRFKFYVSLTDSITTTFDLTDIQLNGGDTIYSKCDLGILSASLSYQLAFLCGDSTLVKFMQLGDNLKIFADAVYPNPLCGENNYQAILPFRTTDAGVFNMKIYDVMGRIVHSDQLTASNAGSYSFVLDGKNLSAGSYMYLLREISNSSENVRGRFIIAK